MPLLTNQDLKDLDFELIGPVLESLVRSERVSSEEKRAIELCARAAADFLHSAHLKERNEFYQRPDVQRVRQQIASKWLSTNSDASPGTSVLMMGRWHVVSCDCEGKLDLFPIKDPWPDVPHDSDSETSDP